MDPEAICLLSGENATVRTSLAWPSPSDPLWRVFLVDAVFRLQSLMVPSHDDERAYLESWERSRSEMKWECPVITFLGIPADWSSSPSATALRFQMIKVLSLDPERRNSL